MDRVGLVVNVSREKAVGLASRLITFFQKTTIQIRLLEEDARAFGHPEIGVPDEIFPEGLDLVVVLGGDGTVLRAARLLGGRDIPLLGVNLGRFGFLSEVEESELDITLEKVLKGRFTLEKRMMLSCEIVDKSSRKQATALNEVVVEKGLQPKLIEITVSINGELFNRYACDGLIFATPTGSTAYSLSANGPIVSPETRLILMTPISPHSFFNRSLILSEKDSIEVTLPNAEKQKVTVSADGAVLAKDTGFDKLSIRVFPGDLSLVKLEKGTFYQVLREKLKIWDTLNG